jgi:Leucine-rich repeat (LRR) protein
MEQTIMRSSRNRKRQGVHAHTLFLMNMPHLAAIPQGLVSLKWVHELVMSSLDSISTMPDMSGMLEMKRCTVTRIPNLLTMPAGLGKAPKLKSLQVLSCVNLMDISDFIYTASKVDATKTMSLCTLEMSENNVVVDGYIGRLSHLTKLMLEDVKVLGGRNTRSSGLSGIPDFSMMPLLEHLTLKCNGLFNFPVGISKLQQLKHLCMSDMSLTEVPRELPQELRTLHLLKYLGLCNINMSKMIDLSNMHQLKTLELEEMPRLVDLGPSIWTLENLEYLSLYEIGIVSLPDAIGNLTSLTTLELSGLAIPELPAAMRNCRKLSVLNMTHCLSCLKTNNVTGHLLQLQIISVRLPFGGTRLPEPCTMFSEICRSISSLRHLRSLRMTGINKPSEMVLVRQALCEPPECLQIVRLDGFMENYWRMALPDHVDSLSYCKSMQQRSVAFALSQKADTHGKVPSVPMLPEEIVRLICVLANGILPRLPCTA